MKALATVIGTLLVSFAAPAAQTLYKSTMPDGKIVYGEAPVPGAKRVDTIEPPPAKTGVSAATDAEKARAAQAAAKASAGASSPALSDARQALQKAEAARDAGKEPLPGERLGTAGGASRLTEAYFERQKALEIGVEVARKRVQDLEKK
ncbi:MAG TPA: DUF4124 domain-containing protein [Burkholderiales bacterium]|nr:DUF4124 domain-containing protein [Burkholderiales bacterium]